MQREVQTKLAPTNRLLPQARESAPGLALLFGSPNRSYFASELIGLTGSTSPADFGDPARDPVCRQLDGIVGKMGVSRGCLNLGVAE